MLEASDILSLDREILRCAILDEAGRIVSYADSHVGRATNLPKDYSITVNALVLQTASESIPKEFGCPKFTVVVTDKYRLVSLALDGQTVIFTLPLSVIPDQICYAAIEKFGTGSEKPELQRH